MKARDEFLLTPGPLPWRVDCCAKRPRSGAVYDADGRLVCVAAIGNAREIVRMANLFCNPTAGCAGDAETAEARGSTSTGN